jgi:8-oxo-dGTP diphosphatase
MPDTEERRMDRQVRGPWLIGAGAVVVENERVLLVRNRFGVTRGRYLLPAGRVNPGEMPDQAAERETLEETGLRVQVTGLLGVRIWAMDDGAHNYFFMFQARLLSAVNELVPNLAEIDDARFFTRTELAELGPQDTWAGAVAVACKVLDKETGLWLNDAGLSSDSGVESVDRWRMWM